WEQYREAATVAQTALERAADDARFQLAALETLTDPSLNPLAGSATVIELLERLRSTISADGVALVQTGRGGTRIRACVGVQPGEGRGSPQGDGHYPTAGRVTVVHNDPARVEQVSALR